MIDGVVGEEVSTLASADSRWNCGEGTAAALPQLAAGPSLIRCYGGNTLFHLERWREATDSICCH